jgi:hypothetical protein
MSPQILKQLGFSQKRLATLAIVVLLAQSTRATFHFWDIVELYSNEDGSIQFIELSTLVDGQELLKNHQIQCSGPGGTHTFTFTNDLPAGTAGKTFIIGTSNLISVPGGLKPDYVMPPNFLFLTIGATNTVNFSGVDIRTYTNLPTDGMASIVRTAPGANMIFNATNSPKNYSNQSNSIVPVKFLNSVASGTNLIFSFVAANGTNSTTGPSYTVQFKDSLNTTNWTTLTNFAGVTSNTMRTVTNGIPAGQRYYRLKVP